MTGDKNALQNYKEYPTDITIPPFAKNGGIVKSEYIGKYIGSISMVKKNNIIWCSICSFFQEKIYN